MQLHFSKEREVCLTRRSLRGIFPRQLTLLSVISCCHRVSFTCKSEVPVPACFSPLPLNIWPQKPWESDPSNQSKLFCISLHCLLIYGQRTSGSFKIKMCWWSHCRQQIISCRCWNRTLFPPHCHLGKLKLELASYVWNSSSRMVVGRWQRDFSEYGNITVKTNFYLILSSTDFFYSISLSIPLFNL